MKLDVKKLTILGLMTAIMIIFAFTPIGSIPIGPLSISLQVIPVAICAVAMGPVYGAIAGGIFGILSFMQAMGIGIPSGMGMTLFAINPFLAFVQRFIPRVLCGLCAGLVFKAVKKVKFSVGLIAGGFSTAFFNTLFFMSSLVMLFGKTEYIQGLMGGKNVLLFIVTFVGINAVVEMIAASIFTLAVGTALNKAGFIEK